MMNRFKFSPIATIIALALSGVMLKASAWQWSRYKEKVKLVESFKQHSRSLPLPFPLEVEDSELINLKYKKVELSGTYDFAGQIAIQNKRSKAHGPGFLLMAPFKLDSSDKSVMISRGFIPYSENDPKNWEKFNQNPKQLISAVVKPTVPHRVAIAPKSDTNQQADGLTRFWKYPDLENIALQHPNHKMITSVFLQRLGNPQNGTFPAEHVSVRVPPRVHFGYTIEWAVLALVTILVSVAYQLGLFRRRTRDFE